MMATVETIRARLNRSRKDLLDLSARNRLISTPRGRSKSRSIEIVDERSDEIFRLIARDRKAMSFLPGKESDDGNGDEQIAELYQPESDGEPQGQLADRHTDARLQTNLTSVALQRRLLNLLQDGRTFEEEQGVSILYLALGFLKWYEAPSSDRPRYAPLLLIPVELERLSAGARFKLKFREEEIATNLSLQAKLEGEFNVRMPDIGDVEELIPSAYCELVRKAVASQARWEVLTNDMVLWFFSFAKFLMYRDLDPENWPAERSLDLHPAIASLLEEGFRSEPPICGDDEKIDPIIAPADLVHVMDADSSQAIAIEEVRRGRHLVIQGPPGTGKSQTISNMIAVAVRENRTVLFVAEKMAALDVVKRRLESVGVGDMCLELHSQKANKRSVVQDLVTTLNLGRPKFPGSGRLLEELLSLRDKLNGHVEILHGPLPGCEITPFEAMSQLVNLRSRGIPPADFELKGAEKWTPAEQSDKRHRLRDLAAHLRGVGVPDAHPWRGVKARALLPTDIDRLKQRLPAVAVNLDRLIAATDALAGELQLNPGETALDSSVLARVAQRLAAAPPLDRVAIASDVWQRRRDDISRIIVAGKTLQNCRRDLDGLFIDFAWTADLTETRRQLAAHGKSWLRWFNKGFRTAEATLRGLLKVELPADSQERVALVDRLIEAQSAQWNLTVKDGDEQLGLRAFGSVWRGSESDWAALEAIDKWEQESRQAKLPVDPRDAIARIKDISAVKRLLKQIASDLKPAMHELQSIFQVLDLDLLRAFGDANLHALPLESLKSRVRLWSGSAELLVQWVQFRNRLEHLEAGGLGSLTQQLCTGTLTADEAMDRFEMAFFEQVMREVVRCCPALAEFDGQSHDRIVELFRKYDQSRIEMARHEVALAHHAKLPQATLGIGEVGILLREAEKKRKHLPVRQLLKQAGTAIQAIKPVFMMSPISVAQFLEPGHLNFDLLLIDEASQFQPVDALGAIARCQQLVVVGDKQQLPPTNFFNKMLANEDDENDDSLSSNVESILGLCSAQRMPSRMLRWHYRSKHESLIAVSNREFYGSRLCVIPSAIRTSDQQGLCFRHVPEGVFDRGGSTTNRIEAAAVATAVMEHARRFPKKSLGVGAFSVAQRDAIRDELEIMRRHDTSCEEFFLPGGSDPFFIKNLENIQGDERDVIFISVGYARNPDGYFAMSFPVLQNEGGERRLNVLISRARDRCEVFSSITPDDIDLNRARSRGVAALKTFLTYAKTGFLETSVATGRDFDSEFEAEVARAISQYGFQVEPQVGIAGFFIDLAIVDPEQSGRYLLGIECDGRAYHSSRSARDRDRLRENLLRSRGWNIHRIWSTDWFHRPEEQIRKTLAAIDRAKSELASGASAPATPHAVTVTAAVPIVRADSETACNGNGGSIGIPYIEARVSTPGAAVGDLSDPELRRLVMKILEVEGPIHREELTRRAVDLAGGKRTTKRAREAVDGALYHARRQAEVVNDGEFYRLPGDAELAVRDRSKVQSDSLRKPEMIPPMEIRAAISQLVKANCGAEVDEVVLAVSRAMGFGTTSAQLRALIEIQVDAVQHLDGVVSRDGKLYPREEQAG